VHADTLTAGVELAGRYGIEDLVGETPRSQLWRAVDRILNRSVSLQVVARADRSAEPFLTAARRATAVEDPRFLRVLDASYEDGFAYVVREWASGVSLDNVLRQGPLDGPRAVEVVREVAEAVAAAHRADVQHRRLDPARILVKHNGAIRLLGLATDQALYAPDEAVEETAVAGEQLDVSALGQLLYACLVARWPGGRDVGLPPAPTYHGRLLRPRRVRAGVEPAVDVLCDRILNGTQQGPHLRTAQQVSRELSVLALSGDDTTSFAPADEEDQTVPRGVIPAAPDPSGPPPAVTMMPPPRTAAEPAPKPPPAPGRQRRTGARVPVWLAILLLAGIGTVVTVLALTAGGDGGSDPAAADEPGPDSATEVLDVEAVSDFDPQGTDGGENPELARLAVDSKPATAWTTSSYFGSAQLGLLKDGVGLLLDLGQPQNVGSVSLLLQGSPTSVQVYAAPGDAARPPTALTGLDPVGEATAGDTELTVRPKSTLTSRWVMVWLTELPSVGTDTYKGAIAEITVRG